MIVAADDVTIPAIGADDGTVAPATLDRWGDKHDKRSGDCGLPEQRTARDESK